ncbi:28S rRNA (cytosine-C(5))-methyltransferase-like isoform X1 [Styela clava]
MYLHKSGLEMALYKTASGVLKSIEEKQGSVKSLVIASKYKNVKQLYALVVETLKYKDVLMEIINKTKLMQGTHISKYEALVLSHDFLFGRGVQCGGRYKKIIHSRKSQLNSALTMMKVKRKVKSNEDLLQKDLKDAINLPKYLRINTLLTSKDDAVEYFKKIGYTLVASRSPHQLQKNEFMIDSVIPYLLVFHPRTDLHNDRLYKGGEIIFQDKASCLPAYILSPTNGSVVIDACAAPGNKTSHMAAIMSNRGKIFAFDLSPQRLSTMDSMLLKAGVLCCQTKVQDFLKVKHDDPQYCKATEILLDPSCSGSGIVNRLNSLTNDDKSSSESRLQSLANFQSQALDHALLFPKVNKVVYSTCSIHTIENENVVMKALEKHPHFELVHILPEWQNRGLPIDGFEVEAKKCIRCTPEHDQTNGFFVALFQRKS